MVLNVRTITRTDNTFFTKNDLRELLFDFRFASIFFEQPLEIEILGNKILVGDGFGGISHSVFERATGCNLCGSCCFTKERANWQWWADEKHPDGLTPVDFRVNGKLDQMFVYKNITSPYVRCGYLVDLPDRDDEMKQFGCSLHLIENPDSRFGIKPRHCAVEFQTCVRPVNTVFGLINMMSRRLPSRNWKSPQCPIDVYNMPITPEQIAEDETFWAGWIASWGNWPGSHVERAYDLWQAETLRRQTCPNPALDTKNIFLFDERTRPVVPRGDRGPISTPLPMFEWSGERQPVLTRSMRELPVL